MKQHRSQAARVWASVCAVLSAACLMASEADAQTPPERGYDDTYADLIGPQPLPDLFDPADVGMTRVDDPQDLMSLLTVEGRCPPRKPASAGMPCAFISYAPENTREDAFANSLRPVFKVEGNGRVWTFLDGGLALVRISDLQMVSDLQDPSMPDASYRPTAIVGYEENQSTCSRLGKDACVDPSHFRTFVEMRYLTPACIDEIWKGRRGGASSVGAQSRCRFREPG